MKYTRLVALTVIAASLSLSIAQAKSLREAGQPAEFPPSSYTGRQYVDSEGCVFVRAGIDGNVTWVPRVTRNREILCGQQPSLPTARVPESSAVPAPTPDPAAAPAPKAAPKPAKTTARRAPAKAATSARKVTTKRAAPKPAPAAPPRAPVAAPARSVAVGRGCVGASAVPPHYMRPPSGSPVRCGPQPAAHVTRVPGTRAVRVAPRAMPAPVYVARVYTVPVYPAPLYRGNGYAVEGAYKRRVVDPYTTRVAPRHVVAAQTRARNVTMPDGYTRVWGDGRLSRHRAHQTFAGKAAMERMWTRTVPRRLILTDTGRDVTAQYPGLIYPHTSYEEQRAAMSARTVTAVRSHQPAPAAATQTTVRARPASHSYVQAGVYATRAQAQQVAQRLAASGLPMHLGLMTKGGTQYSLVLSGPYSSQSALDRALAQVRRAGFSNATLR